MDIQQTLRNQISSGQDIAFDGTLKSCETMLSLLGCPTPAISKAEIQSESPFTVSGQIALGKTSAQATIRTSTGNPAEFGVTIALPAGWKPSVLLQFDAFDGLTLNEPCLTIDYSEARGTETTIQGLLSLDTGLLALTSAIVGQEKVFFKIAVAQELGDSCLIATCPDPISIQPVSNLILKGQEGESGPHLEIRPEPFTVKLVGGLRVPLGEQTLSACGQLIVTDAGLTFAGETDDVTSPLGFQGITLTKAGVSLGAQVRPPALNLAMSGEFMLRNQSPSANAFAVAFAVQGTTVSPQLLHGKLDELSMPLLFESCMNDDVVLPEPFEEIDFRDVYLYWCGTPTVLPDGTQTKVGFGFNGLMNFFDWDAQARLSMDFANGASGEASMEPIRLGAGLVSITGNSETGGPAIAISTQSSPYLSLTQDVRILGIVGNAVHGTIDRDGVHFTLQQQGLSLLQRELSCRLTDPTHFMMQGGLRMGLDLNVGPITIPGTPVNVGNIHIDGSFGGSLAVTITGDAFAGEITGSIQWYDQEWVIPPIKLSVAPNKLDDLAEVIVQAIASNAGVIFRGLVADAASFARNVRSAVFQGTNHSAEEVSKIMSSAYNLSGEQAAAALKGAGYAANEIASAMKRVFDMGSEAVESALMGAGCAADEIGEALGNLFDLDKSPLNPGNWF